MNIYDIAEKSGVSIATVSRVINGTGSVSEKTREKVNRVMQELGYTPNIFARGLMVNSMKTFGVLTIDVRDIYYANAIHTIEQEARGKGYDVILCSTGEEISEKSKYLKLLLQKRVDGIILIGSVFKEKSDNSHILEVAQKVPVIMVNGLIEGENIYSILCDDAQGIYNTVEYLISKGHKNIVYAYDVETFSGVAKLRGFRQALTDKGMETGSSSIVKTAKGIEGGYAVVDKLLKQGEKFTALVAAEDIIAVGMIKRLEESGIRVPEDVAVVGFNNSLFAKCTNPELTSVDNKVEAISSGAAKILVDILEGKNVPLKTVITPELIIRQST